MEQEGRGGSRAPVLFGDELFVALPEERRARSDGGGLLSTWRCVVLCGGGLERVERDAVCRILRRGRATVNPWTLQHLAQVDGERSCLGKLTHIFVDPGLIRDEKFKEVTLN